jgi:release factor glutamine methyltransferase
VNRTAACTRGAVLAEAAAALAKTGVEDPRRRARQLISSALGISRAELLMHPECRLDAAAIDRVRRFVGRVVAGEPPSRVLGRREFWGLDLALSDETLDPRPETETVVEAVLARITDRTKALQLLDLGTGTGCLLLALLSELPAATGVGVDRAAGAAATARRNAENLGLADRARFFAGDWAAALAGQFEVIVANPPYVATGALADLPRDVSGYDPRAALDGGRDGLAAYRALAGGVGALLAAAGIFAAEIGAGQATGVTAIINEHGLRAEAIERDLAGIERCIIARRRAAPRMAGAGS